mmetsp:Transcript_10541/g.30422  ORF Transcript_10541/g.30422 Transcript_10541/m.30422 type:complete len:189 (+) Transcript_10541:955-1521(+)
MTQSPHAPVAGCSSTTAFLNASNDDVNWYRRLVLTDASHAFVAWIRLVELPMVDDPVGVTVYTTEPPVAGAGEAFKDRHPVTTDWPVCRWGPLLRGASSTDRWVTRCSDGAGWRERGWLAGWLTDWLCIWVHSLPSRPCVWLRRRLSVSACVSQSINMAGCLALCGCHIAGGVCGIYIRADLSMESKP